ncbi:MAG: plastocyanin/azurin family copper-binding protein [Chloroflexaceae bacterium]|jgi:plastocyanin|nr:plastocyanin/azurin family copper-binding protein [Chloroflexaceae bacterium]
MRLGAFIFTIVGLFAVVLGLPAAGAQSPERHTIALSSGPGLAAAAPLTIQAGDTVTWTNTDDQKHMVAAADGSFISAPLAPGEAVSRTFETPGSYRFICDLDGAMQSEVVVEPAQSQPAVGMNNRQFSPASLTIQAGQTVTWTNNEALPHNITAADRSFSSANLTQGQTFSRRFDSPGSYSYLCTLHAGMTGTITVQAAGGSTQRRIFLPLVQRGGSSSTPPTTPTPAPTPSPTPPPAQPLPPPTVPTGNLWSNPASWPNGRLPAAGEFVQIPAGRSMVLDVSPPPLRALQIDGTLVFAERDLTLRANWIMVHGGGRLQVGTEAQPFRNRAIIALTGNTSSENVMGMGTKFLGAMGGTIDLHGEAKTSWTKLSGTVEPGATQIRVLEANNWRVGDRIVVAPTDFDPLEAEERTISAINGTTVTLDQPLRYRHWGRMQTLGTIGETMDQRAEVANLSRNITVRGENAVGSTFGGHMMFMEGSTTRLANIEVTGMGQLGRLGRYPVHWHIMNDGGNGSYLRNAAVHTNFQRGIVIHRTNDLLIQNNTVYNSLGHMVFLESSTEVRNLLEGNLVLLTRPVPLNQRNPEIEFEHGSDSRVSGFWISNSHNRIVNNSVAGVIQGIGYWFADGTISFRRDTDLCRDGRVDANGGCHLGPSDTFVQIRNNSPLLEFRANVAHTIRSDAEWGETHHTSAVAVGLFLEINSFAQNTIPVARDFRAWKVTNAAAWPTERVDRSVPQVQRTPIIENMVVSDSRSAVFAAEKVGPVGIRGGVFYGMTDNQPPGVNAATRDYERLFKSYGAHNDDLEVTVLSLYPTILASSNNLTTDEVLAQRRLDGTNEPRFTEWSNVRIQGWPK